MRKKILAMFTAVCLIMSFASPILNVGAVGDDFELFKGGHVSKIYVDANDLPQVVRATGDLKRDIKEVTGAEPQIVSTASELSGMPIVIGTLGSSTLIDALVASGKLNTDDISGKWEAFKLDIIENPVSGVSRALVIAGSDLRGTAYGIYELSQYIGVSPWYWWGDVPVNTKNEITIPAADIEKTDMPDVKYRGIFFNDEENFQYWSKAFENDTDSPGSPNALAYKPVFELMLRLKANILWPAMHEMSDPFNGKINPETDKSFNSEMADRYGIVMGNSHCEMLLRTNPTEWKPWCIENAGKYGLTIINGNDYNASYDYTVNPQAMNAYWEDAVARNYQFENLYTVGLRGVHDAGINHRNLPGANDEAKAGVVRAAIEAQTAILEKYEAKRSEELGRTVEFDTIYCSYKEAATYFRYNLSLPSDTIIVYADDNHGYLRQVPTAAEALKFPSSGVYYHVSYLGDPLSYLWMNSTPLPLIYEEMMKAYNAGADDCWILNVGDLKPAELQTEFFLNLGWNPQQYTYENIGDYIKDISKRDFGLDDTTAAAVADMTMQGLQDNIAKRPEFYGKPNTVDFSLVNFGDEAQKQVNKMVDICDRMEQIYNTLSEDVKPAFYQRIYYSMRAIRYTLEKHTYQQKNQLYLNQGRFASVNAYAKASTDAFNTILSDLKYYNSIMSDGKWHGILDPYQQTRGLPVITGAPTLSYVYDAQAVDGIGSVCEGQASGSEAVTLSISSLTDDSRFIDVWSTGKSAMNYKIVADEALVLTKSGEVLVPTSTASGKNTYNLTVEVEDRVWVSADWSKVTGSTASITVSDNLGFNKSYPVTLTKATIDPSAETTKGYYETNGFIGIEAENYSKSVAVNGQEWKLAKGLGRNGDSMKVYPDLSKDAVYINSNYATTSPYLEYDIYFENTGVYNGTFYRLPTLNETGLDSACRTGYALNDGSVSLLRGNGKVQEYTVNSWTNGVRLHIEEMNFTINVPSKGWHKFRIYKSTPGIAFDRITFRHNSVAAKQSMFGVPESFTSVTEYTKDMTPDAPIFTQSEIIYPSETAGTNLMFDFSNNSTNAHKGYVGVDAGTKASPAKGYAWDSDTFANVSGITRNVEKTSTRDQGFVYGNQPASITINLPEAGRYLVSAAIGDRQSSGYAVNNMNITANGTAALTGINSAAGATIERAFYVEVSGENPKLKLDITGNNWVLSALEIIKYNPPVMDNGTGIFVADYKGDINIEAETANENSEFAYKTSSSDGNNSSWEETYGHSGSGMFAGPNRTLNYTDTSFSAHKGAKMFYKFNAAQAGNYTVWALIKSGCGDDDSVFASIDGGPSALRNDTNDTGTDFSWFSIGSFNISQGSHVLSIWEREDGIVIDKLVISKSSLAPAGLGDRMCRAGATPTRDELEKLITEAEALNADDYIADQFVAVQTALTQAKAISASATQIAIDEACARLKSAMNSLLPADVFGADTSTSLEGFYEFNGNWENSLETSQVAYPNALGGTVLPTLSTTSDEQREEVVRVNSGGSGNYSSVEIPNPLYKNRDANAITVSFWVKGIALDGYASIWTATDGTNYMWLSGALFFGYYGSRGYFDLDRPGAAINNNEWAFVTTTITNERAVVYLNGKEYLNSDNREFTKAPYYSDLERIMDVLYTAKNIRLGGGSYYWGSSSFYADDVSVYARELTAADATKLYLGIMDEPDKEIGDVNGDSNVDIMDIILVRNHILRTELLPDAWLGRADVDDSGKIALADILRIRKIILG